MMGPNQALSDDNSNDSYDEPMYNNLYNGHNYSKGEQENFVEDTKKFQSISILATFRRNDTYKEWK